jgi:hypothetical protein
MSNDEVLIADGSPIIDPYLTDKQLAQVETIAAAAPNAPLRGALDTATEESADAVSVEVFRRAIAQHAGVACQITYAEGDEGTVVVSAFCGNGPQSEHAARLYAIARDVVLALVHMVRHQQVEISRLKANLAPQIGTQIAMLTSDDGGL